jgi:uncharacterized HAD superfamily protein
MRENSKVASAQHKIFWVKVLKPFWFWESNLDEAQAIAKTCDIPVFCSETMKVYQLR